MFLSLTNGCQGEIAIIKKFDINDISIISLTKDNFQERVFKLMLVYWKQAMPLGEFCKTLANLLATYSEDHVAEDFKCDLSQALSNKLLDHIIRL